MKTDNVTESVTMEPGLYEIEIRSTNIYTGGYDVTVNQQPGGSPVPGMSAHSTTGTGVTRQWHHPGGDMEIVVDNGSGATAEIDVFFRPIFPN